MQVELLFLLLTTNTGGGSYLPLYLIVAVVLMGIFIAALFRPTPPGYNGNNRQYSAEQFSRPGSMLWRQRLSAWEENQLRANFQFYRGLAGRTKKKFDDRVVRFMNQKNFEGRHELEVTPEMRLFIASTAIRMTLGLSVYNFPSFHTFLIYPEQFYSRVSGKKVRGETHGLGVIAFSWEDYLFGMADDNDNLNLGYHEFAHALFIEHFRNSIDSRFAAAYDSWRSLVYSKGKLHEASLKNTFRAYANYNEHEFFAVSVENFFERPEKFRQDLPKLYQWMVRMMNQDPLASGSVLR